MNKPQPNRLSRLRITGVAALASAELRPGTRIVGAFSAIGAARMGDAAQCPAEEIRKIAATLN